MYVCMYVCIYNMQSNTCDSMGLMDMYCSGIDHQVSEHEVHSPVIYVIFIWKLLDQPMDLLGHRVTRDNPYCLTFLTGPLWKNHGNGESEFAFRVQKKTIRKMGTFSVARLDCQRVSDRLILAGHLRYRHVTRFRSKQRMLMSFLMPFAWNLLVHLVVSCEVPQVG